DRRMPWEPGERQLRRRAGRIAGEGGDLFRQPEALVVQPLGELGLGDRTGAPRWVLPPPVLSGEDAPAKRKVRDQADALVPAEGDEFALDRAVGQRVARLDGLEPDEAAPVARPQRLRQLPGGEVGRPDVPDLAGPDHVI